jgi:hypothetical protein
MQDLFQGCLSRIGFVVVMIAALICGAVFTIGTINNGLEDTLNAFYDAPRDLFCSVVPFCDNESIDTALVDEQILWTKISERTVLDLGKFERRGDWHAERQTLVVTHTKNMRGTVNITMGMDLSAIEPEDIVVDQEALSIRITLPPVQPVECFVNEVEYYGGFCIEVCDELERDLQRIAIERSLDGEDFGQALVNAEEDAKSEIATILDIGNIADVDYTLQYVESTEDPPQISGATCPERD